MFSGQFGLMNRRLNKRRPRVNSLVQWLFGSEGFMPHGMCHLWRPDVLWLNVGSDALIAASYFGIPAVLGHFTRRRRNELPFPWIPYLFAAFIFLCGTTHVMGIWTVRHPNYCLRDQTRRRYGIHQCALEGIYRIRRGESRGLKRRRAQRRTRSRAGGHGEGGAAKAKLLLRTTLEARERRQLSLVFDPWRAGARRARRCFSLGGQRGGHRRSETRRTGITRCRSPERRIPGRAF